VTPGERFSAWAPAVAWAAVIFFMSTEEFAAEHTGRWLEWAVRLILPSLSPRTFDVLHVVLRKLAHVGEYFVLALLLDRGWRQGSSLRPRWVPLAAFVVAALYSLTDEWHQSFVADRTASLLDCGFDSVGAAMAVRATARKAYLA
jgi:VanZ family protein